MSKRSFWVQIDEGSGNPVDVCWGYYESDRPTIGDWVLASETDEPKERRGKSRRAQLRQMQKALAERWTKLSRAELLNSELIRENVELRSQLTTLRSQDVKF
jgi:hypothetical protein